MNKLFVISLTAFIMPFACAMDSGQKPQACTASAAAAVLASQPASQVKASKEGKVAKEAAQTELPDYRQLPPIVIPPFNNLEFVTANLDRIFNKNSSFKILYSEDLEEQKPTKESAAGDPKKDKEKK